MILFILFIVIVIVQLLHTVSTMQWRVLMPSVHHVCAWKASDRMLERSNRYSVMEVNDDGTPIPVPPTSGYGIATVVTLIIAVH